MNNIDDLYLFFEKALFNCSEEIKYLYIRRFDSLFCLKMGLNGFKPIFKSDFFEINNIEKIKEILKYKAEIQELPKLSLDKRKKIFEQLYDQSSIEYSHKILSINMNSDMMSIFNKLFKNYDRKVQYKLYMDLGKLLNEEINSNFFKIGVSEESVLLW